MFLLSASPAVVNLHGLSIVHSWPAWHASPNLPGWKSSSSAKSRTPWAWQWIGWSFSIFHLARNTCNKCVTQRLVGLSKKTSWLQQFVTLEFHYPPTSLSQTPSRHKTFFSQSTWFRTPPMPLPSAQNEPMLKVLRSQATVERRPRQSLGKQPQPVGRERSWGTLRF